MRSLFVAQQPDPNAQATALVIVTATLLVVVVLSTFALIWSWKRYNKRLRNPKRDDDASAQGDGSADIWITSGRRLTVADTDRDDDEIDEDEDGGEPSRR